MPLDARTLLSGPRGRRLCLAVALHDPQQSIPAAASLGYLLVYAAHHLEAARGQGGTFFGWGIPDPLPEPSAEEVADAFDCIPLTSIGIVDALDACAASVDSARYWQEPDGSDELLSDEHLDSSLLRIAEHIVTSPSTEWWGSPMEPQQWAVKFQDPCFQVPEPPAAAETLRLWSGLVVENEQAAVRERPTDPTANYSGDWWSRPPFGLTATTRALPELGPVGLWLIEDRSDEEPADTHPVTYEGAPRVFEIVAAESWAELCRRYPLEVTATRRHDWYRATGRSGKWMMPDWSRVARDFDAVHLSLAAYLSAAGVAIPLDDDFASVIAGWNPDETYWFTDVVTHPVSGASWMREEQTARWKQR
ncbi:hypothetical protein [Salinibacterium sp. M195]|uniref:hypothetical protein n=1 Tax=Salinibacterium sp. M195 TaxID=2583374 RepID=UPI001C63364C|nr:hypothetical protein [Salinibacterium sp. M195]QYH34759.1 hypothetical protein FFT87_01685 [Salinibacterium sp. M195]